MHVHVQVSVYKKMNNSYYYACNKNYNNVCNNFYCLVHPISRTDGLLGLMFSGFTNMSNSEGLSPMERRTQEN